MPKKFSVTLPSSSQRLRILGLILKDTRVDKANLDLGYLVRVTAGMSGSDIKEACRDAAMVPVKEYIRRKRESGAQMDAVDPNEIRGLRTGDFFGSAGGIQVSQQKLPKRRDVIDSAETSSNVTDDDEKTD